ncbi:DNA-3-methyladenine glycosylase family protein [Paenibacillus sp. PL91]|uniref:DNA-3-methyladenine glycosylase family protein n=1 Tax=Paenibacillus sp. PL91 TaxID=2729538 RepID=UPI00145E1104|nr:DNA-3-methyladenine glycosylase 2 family protein [Paenibacillus sp. PL91]MBC9203675.1 DNA-3-methyladenine glycosylase 2 family protein [Paenibacillus sp. PL91]
MQYLFDIHPNNRCVRELCENDPLLDRLVNRIGHIRISSQQDGFTYLTRSLVGQQLSAKAAETIFRRVELVCGTITPDTIIVTKEELLRSAGLSKNKLSYIRNVAEWAKEGMLDFQVFDELDDEEVVRLLTSIKGVGQWTAEMFLIFYLGRQDVISFGDRGLNRAADWLYATEESDGTSQLQRKHVEWKPYSSIVSLYLWEAINTGLIQTEPLIKINLDTQITFTEK